MITPTNNTFNGPDYEAIRKATTARDFSKISELLKDFFTSFTIEQENKVIAILNERTHNGSSFVHYAVNYYGLSKDYVQLLMSCGANFSLRALNPQGKEIPNSSPLDWMGETYADFGWSPQSMIRQAILTYLQSAMDKVSSENKQYKDTINVSGLIMEYYPNPSWVNEYSE